jgi:Co/Zn/Cd efflux system component
MRASWIFLSNDVIANLGVVIAGILVTLLHSRFPDLIMGSIIAIIVLGGGIKIIRETRSKTLQSS